MKKVQKNAFLLIFYVLIGFGAYKMHSMYPVLPYPDWLVGVSVSVLILSVVFIKSFNPKKYRRNVEYGSARWGKSDDIKPFTDPDPMNNIILTQTESLTMSSRPSKPKYARNKNIAVIGGSGSGKTRFFVKPNIMQCLSKKYPVSFVVTDPKGTILVETGKMLRKFGYKIKVLNTINFNRSMHYNPFPLLYKGGKRNNPQNTRQSLRLRHKRTDTASAFQPGKEKVMNELTYERVGDYLLPCIRLSDPPDAPPLGRYGTMHKEYLRRERPALYATLLLTERLYPLCREIDEAASHRLTVIGNREIAHEVILSEIVYI